VVKAELEQRDGLSQPTPWEIELTGGSGSVRLDPDDLSRFEGEGGPALPEPAAPEPRETNDAAQSSAAKKRKTTNERTLQYEAFHNSHPPDVLRRAGLDLAQEGGFEPYNSSYLAGSATQDQPQAQARPAFIGRPSPPEPLAGRHNAPANKK
jgi:hypothetical protein